MVLDQPGVLADEVVREVVDRLEDEAMVRPKPGLAGADESVAGVDAHEKATIDQKWLDPVDPADRRSIRLHCAAPTRAGAALSPM
jgi:hypothetical protein